MMNMIIMIVIIIIIIIIIIFRHPALCAVLHITQLPSEQRPNILSANL